MNLTLGICWIEDQASEAEVQAVENAVRANGFEPEIERVGTEEEIRQFAANQEHFQDYELIVLDLMLGRGLRGDELAPQVRRRFRSTPILFYSADTEDNLRRAMAEKRVDGVYCAHRDRLAVRVGELVLDLSPALNRLSGMRGLAARIVAECDQEFRQILRGLTARQVSESDLVASLRRRVSQTRSEQVARLSKKERLEDLLGDQAVSSGLLFAEVFACMEPLSLTDEVRDARRSIRRYGQLVLERRNTLAHALEKRERDGWKIVRRGSNPDVTVRDFPEYRSQFLSHLRDVRRLRELLVQQEST